MVYTQAPRRTNALAVVAHEETQWRAAHVQAASLEGAELKQAGDEERHRADEPGMNCQPRPQSHQEMHQRVSEKGTCRKGRPDGSMCKFNILLAVGSQPL